MPAQLSSILVTKARARTTSESHSLERSPLRALGGEREPSPFTCGRRRSFRANLHGIMRLPPVVFALAAALSSAACTHWQAHFEPRSVTVDTRPVVGQAVVLYGVDAGILRAIPATQELGTVELDGRHLSSAQINYFAARFAAKQGATHIVRMEHKSSTAYIGNTPVQLTTIGTNTFASGGQPVFETTDNVLFLAFKVPVSAWSELPPTLIPKPVDADDITPTTYPAGPGPALPPPQRVNSCFTAAEHLHELANALVNANPGRQPVEDLPAPDRFLKLCAPLPADVQTCLIPLYLDGHKDQCRASFQAAPARDWLLIERLFLAPQATSPTPSAPPAASAR